MTNQERLTEEQMADGAVADLTGAIASGNGFILFIDKPEINSHSLQFFNVDSSVVAQAIYTLMRTYPQEAGIAKRALDMDLTKGAA